MAEPGSLRRVLRRAFGSALPIVCSFGLSMAAADAQQPVPGEPDRPNGFVLEPLTVPRASVVEGGPARDAIRSVDAPRFVPPAEARWVAADTPIIGVATEGRALAYPVHLMEWHQVVNERVGDASWLVVYDPLTDVAGAWRSNATPAPDSFGVSGLLDGFGFLLFDRATSSLWSPLSGRAISGPRAGEGLVPMRVRVETMARWLARHPDTLVLALPDRDRIDYRLSPYSSYWISDDVPLAVTDRDDRFHPKEVVLGVEAGGRSRAYIASIVTRAGGRIVDEFASQRIRIEYDGESGTFSYDAPEAIRVQSAYWFAWKNRHPATDIWREDLAGAPIGGLPNRTPDGVREPDPRTPAP